MRFPIVALTLLASALVASAMPTPVTFEYAQRKVSPAVMNNLGTEGSSTIIVELVPVPEDLRPAAQPGFAVLSSLAERRAFVAATLRAHSARMQAPIMRLLRSRGFDMEKVQPMWVRNVVMIQDATQEIIEALAVRPDVIEVRADEAVATILPYEDNGAGRDVTEAVPNAFEWNVNIMNVPEAWKLTKGEGVVIANIDTGVRFTHRSVINNYRGTVAPGVYKHDYSWHDSKKKELQPKDFQGHGSHTMGSIVGDEGGFGVAPGAKWIAAVGCRTSSCSESDLTSSAQWVICPTDLNGKNPDCSKGANVVSNSWGGGQADPWYSSYIRAWREAGIIPIFSQGNSGSSCSTANSPADSDLVIGVGATDKNDALASFSSRGPGPKARAGFAELKPDISAPGEAVISINSSSDTATKSLSGTSMAAPQVAGVVALMLSANPSLTYSDIEYIIESTANQKLPAPKGGQKVCGNKSFDVFPNYHYGHGRIDAAAAVKAAAALL